MWHVLARATLYLKCLSRCIKHREVLDGRSLLHVKAALQDDLLTSLDLIDTYLYLTLQIEKSA